MKEYKLTQYLNEKLMSFLLSHLQDGYYVDYQCVHNAKLYTFTKVTHNEENKPVIRQLWLKDDFNYDMLVITGLDYNRGIEPYDILRDLTFKVQNDKDFDTYDKWSMDHYVIKFIKSCLDDVTLRQERNRSTFGLVYNGCDIASYMNSKAILYKRKFSKPDII